MSYRVKETHHKAVLTWPQVRAIRGRYQRGKRGGDTQVKLAREFGVHQTVISRIVRGRIWKERGAHVPA